MIGSIPKRLRLKILTEKMGEAGWKSYLMVYSLSVSVYGAGQWDSGDRRGPCTYDARNVGRPIIIIHPPDCSVKVPLPLSGGDSRIENRKQ